MIESTTPSGIGDVHGTTKGSAARFNTGKPDLSLVPLRLIAEQHKDHAWAPVLAALGEFQETAKLQHLHAALDLIGDHWDECSRVLEYGKVKYAPWNWARGQAWSVCLASAARHIVFGIMAGEEVDPESKCTHRGHVMANITFLRTFMRTYPEGNDLPTQWLDVASPK